MREGKVALREFEVVQGPRHYDAAPEYEHEGLGLTVRGLTYEVRRYFQKGDEEPGVVAAKIEPGGKASVGGVKPYELITHVNDEPVPDVAAFERLTATGGELRLSVKRMARGRVVKLADVEAATTDAAPSE